MLIIAVQKHVFRKKTLHLQNFSYINLTHRIMKRLFIFATLLLMSISLFAQNEGDKGPLHVETDNFSVDVPKGWSIYRISNGSLSRITMKPDVRPDGPTNFGYEVTISSFHHKSATVEKYVDEAMKQFGEGKTRRMPDYKNGKITMAHTYFDEGHGSYQTLSVPMSDEGAVKVTVNTYPLTDKAVKSIIKSLVVK